MSMDYASSDASPDFSVKSFGAALEYVGQGVVIFDGRKRVVFENPLAQQWLHSETPSISYDDLCEIAEFAIAGQPSSRTLDFLGAQRNSLNVRGIPVEGDEPGAVIILEDTTERRHFEDSRRDFIANVSHELKTPVGALGLLAETLLVEKDPEVVERLINRMHVEAVRVATVIDDLLSLSRIESGPVEFELMNARSLVDQAVNRVGVTAEHRQTMLNVYGDAEATVFGSHRDIVSAIHHLLENALKYSPDGSSVEVRITALGDLTEISVTDHGIGIDQKYVERIFERFYRVDDARTRATGGTGLGLSIVRHVVQAHGGDIRVTSQQGEGSTFTVRFAATSSAGTKQLVVEGGTDG
jgi:two-component system sensor histidine kinase SenX3